MLSDHVLYGTALTILMLLSVLPGIPVPLFPLRTALMEWSRAAELSCDRAAALVTRDPLAICRTLMVLSAGAEAANLDLDVFIEQGREYREKASAFDRISRLLSDLNLTHPMSVQRVHELISWVESGAYDRIVAGEYPRRDEPADVRAEAGDAVNHYSDRLRDTFRGLAGLGRGGRPAAERLAAQPRRRGRVAPPPGAGREPTVGGGAEANMGRERSGEGLERFVRAQDAGGTYERALAELQGRAQGQPLDVVRVPPDRRPRAQLHLAAATRSPRCPKRRPTSSTRSSAPACGSAPGAGAAVGASAEEIFGAARRAEAALVDDAVHEGRPRGDAVRRADRALLRRRGPMRPPTGCWRAPTKAAEAPPGPAGPQAGVRRVRLHPGCAPLHRFLHLLAFGPRLRSIIDDAPHGAHLPYPAVARRPRRLELARPRRRRRRR